MNTCEKLADYFDKECDIKSYDLKAIAKFHVEAKETLFLDYLCPDKDRRELPEKLEGLEKLLEHLFSYHPEIECGVERFMCSLAPMRELAYGSAKAIYEGDPAALSIQEVILAFPGFKAILSYRIANKLLEIGLPFEARYISEIAHQRTGIDINPGAKIGKDFFIDHGTGIVIGETAIIGNGVKLYQGVTLGALSLEKGQELKGIKRHPTLEDHVAVYSNASIFGGDTVIGHNSVIGSSVSITKSIPPYTLARMDNCGLSLKTLPHSEE